MHNYLLCNAFVRFIERSLLGTWKIQQKVSMFAPPSLPVMVLIVIGRENDRFQPGSVTIITTARVQLSVSMGSATVVWLPLKVLCQSVTMNPGVSSAFPHGRRRLVVFFFI